MAPWSSSEAWSTPSRCAVELQKGMAERAREVPEDRQIWFRIGINLGDIIIEDDDIHGDGVNVAARLEGLAEPGGICVSRTVRNHVQDKLSLAFEDLGERTLKTSRARRRSFASFRMGASVVGVEQGASRRQPLDAGPWRRSCRWSPPAAPGAGWARTMARWCRSRP